MNGTELLKILLLEDDLDDAGLLHYELKKLSIPYEIKIADNKERYEFLIEDFQPDIILSDYNIPGYSVFEALELARIKDELIPFIIISGVMGETKAIEAMLNGVNDCIMKDNIIRLIPSIEREVTEVNNRRLQRKEHEELLIFKEVFNNSYNSIAIITNQGDILDFNQTFSKLHGYDSNMINTITIYDIFGKENASKIIEEIKTNGSYNGEIKYNSFNGDIVYSDISSFTIKQKPGNSPLMIIIEKNLTESKNVLSEKQESERKLEFLISNLPGIVYRCRYDEHWTMLFLSDSVFPITGYVKDDLLNNKELAYEDLIYEPDREHVRKTIDNSIEKEKRFSIYYRVVRKDGKIIWVWEKGTLISNDKGIPSFIEGYIEDITFERKQMLELDHLSEKDKQSHI